MDFEDKREQLLAKLIRATLENKIIWKLKKPPYSLNQATENYVPLYFETNYNNTRIGVYEIREKSFTDVDEYYWIEKLGICIVQEPEVVVWQDEGYSPALNELFNMVRHYVSGLDNLLK